jgi:hypothetical protein
VAVLAAPAEPEAWYTTLALPAEGARGGGVGIGAGGAGIACLVWCTTAPNFDNWFGWSGSGEFNFVSISRSQPLSLDDLDEIGKGKDPSRRSAPGGDEAAEAVWEGWKRNPDVDVRPLPGENGWIGERTNGEMVIYRPRSKSGDAAIDYKRPGQEGNTRIHFGS